MKHKQLNHIVKRMSSDCYHEKDSDSIIMLLYNLSLITEVEQELVEMFSEIDSDIEKVLEKMKLYVTLQYSMEFALNRAIVKIIQQDLIPSITPQKKISNNMTLFNI